MKILLKEFKTKCNKAHKDEIYEALLNKHIQLPIGFTQDNFWYDIGSCENLNITYN